MPYFVKQRPENLPAAKQRPENHVSGKHGPENPDIAKLRVCRLNNNNNVVVYRKELKLLRHLSNDLNHINYPSLQICLISVPIELSSTYLDTFYTPEIFITHI